MPSSDSASSAGLPVFISVPAASSWLISRYRILCGYIQNQAKVSGGTAEFDYHGGTFTGVIQPNTDGSFAATVTVDISVEYTVESGLPTLQLTKDVTVTAAGARFGLELPHRRLSEFAIYFELPHGVLLGDYLMLIWSYLEGANTITTSHRLIRDKEMLDSTGKLVGPYTIGFIADPAPTSAEIFHLETDGTYFGTSLPKFKSDYPLSQPVIKLFLKDDAQGGGFHIEG
jgi:hypothetical protein